MSTCLGLNLVQSINRDPHATKLIFHTPVPGNKMEVLVHSTTRNAPYKV